METEKSGQEIADDLGISRHLLYKWRRDLRKKGGQSFSGQGKKSMTPQEEEIARLKKQLREAELERDILKKAVSIFSKNDGKYSNS